MHPKNLPKRPQQPSKSTNSPHNVHHAEPIEAPRGARQETRESLVLSEQFSGPLPHPSILHGYEQIVPGSAANIVESFVQEGRHRREREMRDVRMREDWAKADIGLQGRGQIFGFIIAMTGIIGGLLVAALWSPLGGASISGLSLATIVVAFLRQGKSGKED
jgi:uncharacterized membrane protein